MAHMTMNTMSLADAQADCGSIAQNAEESVACVGREHQSD